MVWAWMLSSPHAFGTRTLLWFGLGYSRDSCPYALGTRTFLWFEHGCSCHRIQTEICLGMDALVTVCSWNTNVIMIWTWILS